MLIGNDTALVVSTELGFFTMQEDSGQGCIHIWLSEDFLGIDKDYTVEVDCNHIRIFKEKYE